jgi:hypothetical protein
MSNVFTPAERIELTNYIGSNYSIKVFSDEMIDTEKQFDDLYKKSRGCIMENDWCMFFTDNSFSNKKTGNVYKFSEEGCKMIVEKFKVELK